ncbi:Transposase [Oopsacas minuta]|uniref:Transposase n=1 Tax=Oopsacas minuta TaxID=111878 RepID=A0AAV7KD27_9METZ|nr:Transposase [Oopsacas minuta]
MAKELKISRGSLQTIDKRDLGLSSFKKRKVHFLSNKIKTKRLSRSKILHIRFAAEGLDQVLFSDEKHFTVEQAFNRQNDRILSKSTSTIPDEYRYVKRVQKPLSLMVWARVSSVGRTPLVFVPAGVKINAATCKELILQPIVKDLGEMMFETSRSYSNKGSPTKRSTTKCSTTKCSNLSLTQMRAFFLLMLGLKELIHVSHLLLLLNTNF